VIHATGEEAYKERGHTNEITHLVQRYTMFCNRQEVHAVAYKHRVCTMQIDKNRLNTTIIGKFGDRATGLQIL